MEIKAVLFDFDDTVGDRAGAFRRWAHSLCDADDTIGDEEQRAEVVALMETWDGNGYVDRDELLQNVASRWPHLSRPSDELLAWYRTGLQSNFAEDASVITMLKSLRSAGIPYGIVTNGDPAQQRGKIQMVGLEPWVACVLISGEVGYAKPDAEIFLEALRQLGSIPGETLFVGDHPERDIVGAAGVGMRTAWMAHGRTWPARLAPPDFTLSSLADLKEIVGVSFRT
jgi:putative hydrolase of the HAD superfamily